MAQGLVHALVAQGVRPRVLTRASRSNANLRKVLDRIDLVHGDFIDNFIVDCGVDSVYGLITTTFPNMVSASSNYDLLSNLLPTIRMLEISALNWVCAALSMRRPVARFMVSRNKCRFRRPIRWPPNRHTARANSRSRTI